MAKKTSKKAKVRSRKSRVADENSEETKALKVESKKIHDQLNQLVKGKPEPPPKKSSTPVENLEKRMAWEQLESKLRELRKIWLRVPGVTGLDLGYKIIHGVVVRKKPKDWPEDKEWFDVVLRLHVKEKAVEGKDANGRELPSWQKFLPDGDVIEASYQAQQHDIGTMPTREANLMGRFDPIVGGASVGNQFRRCTGTLGLVVWDLTDGRPCILSNWHVLADGAGIVPGAPIYQPGAFDGTTQRDRVALLKRGLMNQNMDAALAELTGERPYAAGAIWNQRPVVDCLPMADLVLGCRLVKSGRTTGETRGFTDGILGAYVVDYGGAPRLLLDQIHIAPEANQVGPISLPGDSGSVWLHTDNGITTRAAALHFAGDASGAGLWALATPIETVAEGLKFSVTPECLMCQEDLEKLRFTEARARAAGRRVGDPIGGGGAQAVGDQVGGGGAQPVGDQMGGGGVQAVGDQIGGGGAQPVGDQMGGGGGQ